MPGPVSVLNYPLLEATVLAIKTAPREIRANIRRYSKAGIGESWRTEITREASSGVRSNQAPRVIAKSSRVSVSDTTVTVKGAMSNAVALSGGLRPRRYGKAIEFGSKTYKQLRPHVKRGVAFYPAANEMTPRLLSLWAATTVRTIMDALEGKR